MLRTPCFPFSLCSSLSPPPFPPCRKCFSPSLSPAPAPLFPPCRQPPPLSLSPFFPSLPAAPFSLPLSPLFPSPTAPFSLSLPPFFPPCRQPTSLSTGGQWSWGGRREGEEEVVSRQAVLSGFFSLKESWALGVLSLKFFFQNDAVLESELTMHASGRMNLHYSIFFINTFSIQIIIYFFIVDKIT